MGVGEIGGRVLPSVVGWGWVCRTLGYEWDMGVWEWPDGLLRGVGVSEGLRMCGRNLAFAFYTYPRCYTPVLYLLSSRGMVLSGYKHV